MNEPATDLEPTEDPEKSRYALTKSDGTLVGTMDYQDNGETITVMRVFTVPAHRGNGYAARLMEQFVDRIGRRGDRNVATVCWFASDWFGEHPEHQQLLR